MDLFVDAANSRSDNLQNHGQGVVSNSSSGARDIVDGDAKSANNFSKSGAMIVAGSDGRIVGQGSGFGKGIGGAGRSPLGAFTSNMPVPGMTKAPLEAISSLGQPLQGSLASVRSLPQQVFSPLASMIGGGGAGMPGGFSRWSGGSMSPMGAVGSLGGSGSGSGSGSGDVKSRLDQFVSKTAGVVDYAWGAGHDTGRAGPSQGIHDGGGAADAHGDYRKQGVDCSGYSRWALATITGNDVLGASTSQSQYGAGTAVSSPRAADLGFPPSAFVGGGGPHHVQVYLGDGMVAEAPQSGEKVRVRPVAAGTVFRRYLSGVA
jgi:cell wall-associated NlpC family hydrolase